MRRILMAVATVLLATGCFHTTIETGLPAGTEVISKPWANSFVYGLVPPATIETAAKCKSGVAKVETQISFMNGLVAALTWSLYTPMTITVTCASSSKMSALTGDADGAVIRVTGEATDARVAALNEAVETAMRTGKPALLVF